MNGSRAFLIKVFAGLEADLVDRWFLNVFPIPSQVEAVLRSATNTFLQCFSWRNLPMSTAEAAEAQLTEYLRSEVVKVEKECIRPLQVEAFRCSAKCCEDQKSSQEVLQRCLVTCGNPVVEAENRMQSEVQQLQDRLTRCAQQCQDEYKDSLGSATAEPKPQDVERASQCLVKCCDTNSKLIPKLIARYKSSLKNCK